MPLSPPANRSCIHERSIQMFAFQRDDGLFDIESHLVDTKPIPIQRLLSPVISPPGTHLHDLWIRLTVEKDFVVKFVEASSDHTPYQICKNAESSLSVLIGEQLGKGWTKVVKNKLRGVASCTHLAEMLIPMATVAFQGINGLRFKASLDGKIDGLPSLINTCYAYSDQREVVMQLWPNFGKDNQP